MHRDIQLLALSATGPLVVGGIAFGLLKGASAPLPPGSAVDRAIGRTTFRDLIVTGRADGQTAWVVRAPRVATGPDRSRVDFEGGVEAVLHRESVPRIRCRARSGHFASGDGVLHLEGPVDATVAPAPTDRADDVPAEAGTLHLRTNRLEWRTSDRRVDAPTTVDITFDRGVARVDALRLDMDQRTLETRQFRGRFLVREEDL